MRWERWAEYRPVRFGLLLLRRWLRHGVAVQSAALAFYLLFTVFPLLIFVSALLGLLQPDPADLLGGLRGFLPREVTAVAEMYLNHVGARPSPRLLLFGMVFSVYFPMRATNALMRAVRTAYHLGPPRSALFHRLKTLAYTVLLIATVALTLTLMTVGERLLGAAVVELGVPPAVAVLWQRLRFPVIAAAGYLALVLLYALAQDEPIPPRELRPGAAAALGAWLVLNGGYALYAERFAEYSALYGSIGAVIVLLVWLNLSAAVLILGAEVNGVLNGLRKDRMERMTADG